MITLQLGKVNATAVAELFGTSRDAVYAAGYRYRQGYPARRRRGALGVKYVPTERPRTSSLLELHALCCCHPYKGCGSCSSKNGTLRAFRKIT